MQIVRNEAEIDIKWMLTISLLFHLFFLFPLLSSNRLIRYNPPEIYMPLSAVHISIVGVVNERPLEIPDVENANADVEKTKESIKKEKTEFRSQKPEVRSEKPEQEAAMIVPEVKEKVAVEQKREFRSQKSSPPHPSPPIEEDGEGEGGGTKGNQSQELLHPTGGNEQAAGTAVGTKEARLVPQVPMISGPVVDIPNFKYDYYLGVIRNKIDSRWSQPIAYTKIKQTLIEFTIRRNGGIDNVRVTESSGDYYFDQTALRAVSLSNPLPPLPQGYKGDVLKVRYRFIFGGKG